MKKIISILLCVMMLAGAIPMTSFANESKSQMPFIDVEEGKWYYDAVKAVWENGYMAGTSDTTFTPNGALTRAMFVTILSAVSGDDLSGITSDNTTGFSDVVSGKWYVKAIKWAIEKGITAGMGETFGVNKPLTRAQMAVMMYKFSSKGGETLSESNIDKYCDASSIPAWAKEAVKFVSKYELMSGTATVNGAPVFSSNGTATRAQSAVVINKMTKTPIGSEYPVVGFTLNGNDISKYTIVYGETASYNRDKSARYAREAATKLSECIKKATGAELAVVKDSESEPLQYEILIGKTNREGAGVTIDRELLAPESEYIEMQGDKLVIASDDVYESTFYAVYRFLEECMGYVSMGNGCELIASSIGLNVEDGYKFVDAPVSEYRMNYQWNGNSPELRSDETRYRFANIVHTLKEFSMPDFDASWEFHLKYYLDEDPCLSKSSNIENIIRSVKLICSKTKNNLIWVTQCDGTKYCKCDSCAQIYRTWGRCATYIQILQHVGNAIKEEYPNIRIVGLPYKYTHMTGAPLKVTVSDAEYEKFKQNYTERIVPEQSLVCPDNVILCVATDNACSSHPLGDTSCENISNNNAKFEIEMQTWCQICKNIYIWDYLNGDKYEHQVFPVIHQIYANYQFYKKYNVKGFYMLGASYDYSDFSALKSYLIGLLSWDYNMTEEEYFDKVDMFLKAYYGNGWSYIREYIDATEELSSKCEFHVWTKCHWDDIIKPDDYNKNIEYLKGLIEKALSLTDSEEEALNVMKLSVQIYYAELCVVYQNYLDEKNAGNTAAASELFESFKAKNYQFHDLMDDVGYKVATNWTLEGNPADWATYGE